MKITLHKDWDSLPSGLANPSPYFSGRAKELAQLKHILLNKTAGSILIGAPRGVGKTDLVYKSIAEVISENKSIAFIPIVLNATQLNVLRGTEDLPQAIITNLITRIYAVCNGKVSDELFEDIATLYYQATSKTYEERTTITDKNETAEQNIKAYQRLSVGRLSLDKMTLEIAIKDVVPVGAISVSFMMAQIKGIPYWGHILVYSFLLLMYILSRAIDFSIDIKKDKRRSNQVSKNKKLLEQAEILYLKDNSFGNLEAGLKNVLQKIQDQRKYKIVFVIDELDKVKVDKGPEGILEMIQTFKGLFNHSDALFIFICDFLVFQAATTSREQRKTSVLSTLFTERIYITRPSVSDLKEYLKRISKKYDGNAVDFDSFTDLIIYKSHMDFFSLADNLRDCEDSYSNGCPILSWEENPDNLQKVNKQKIITALLEEGNYFYTEPSNRSRNEELIESMYDIAEKISPFEIAQIPDDPKPEEKTRLQLEADTANLMYRAEIFQRGETARTDVSTYTFTPTSLPGKAITKLKAPLEYEKEFLDRVDSFEEFILRIYNFRSDILNLARQTEVTDSVLQDVSRISGLLSDLYLSNKSVYEELKKDPAKHDLNQEKIKSYIEELDKHSNDIVQKNTLLIFKNVFEEGKFPVWNLLKSREMLSMLPKLDEYVQNETIENLLLKKEAESNRNVIFLLTPPDTIANRKDVFDELRANRKTNVVELYSNETMPNISMDKGNKYETILIKDFNFSSKQIKNLLKKIG